jgi:hypothetical protein
MLDSEEEVSQVLSFVSSNTSKLLQLLCSPAVLPYQLQTGSFANTLASVLMRWCAALRPAG